MTRFAVLLLAVAALAQQPAVIQTEARVVLVDAIVTAKNGAYVRDLTRKDFHIFEDNREQPISGFAFEASPGPAQPRSIVLFFDESSMVATDQIPARLAAARLIDAEAGPNRRIAVVSYDGALRVTQNFTDNAGRLKDAIPKPASRVTDDDLAAGRGRGGAIDDTGARNMLQSLRRLGVSLGALPGRKILILFAGRLRSSPSQKADLRDAIEASNKSGVAVYPVDVRPFAMLPTTPRDLEPPAVPRGGRGGMQGDLGGVDLGAPDTASTGQQLLGELARRTGGFVVQSSNDLLPGLQEIAAEQDEYYALTFTPAASKEGSCHTLRIKVDRPGTTVRARNSYCTAKPEDLLAGTIPGKELEQRAAESQSGTMAASVQLAYFYASPNVVRVHVAAEITPGTLKFERIKNKLHAEINLLGIASASDGDVRARFSDNLKFDFDNEPQIAAWKSKPVQYEKDFRIASGQYKFTLAFGEAGESSQSFGKVDVPLTVDAWNGSELGVSGVVLSRETHPAADIGLTLAVADQTPLVADGKQVIPSGSDKFAKAGPGVFYLEFYDPDPASLVVRVRAIDAKTGETKWDSGNTRLPIPANGGKPSLPAMARLPLDKLPSGSYKLEVDATDGAHKQVTRTTDFEIQ